jgi:hypothetical protein
VVGVSPTGRKKVLCEGCKKYFAAGGGITSHHRHSPKCDPNRRMLPATSAPQQTLQDIIPDAVTPQGLQRMFQEYESDESEDDIKMSEPERSDDDAGVEEPAASVLFRRGGATTRKRYSILQKLKAVQHFKQVQADNPGMPIIDIQQRVADEFHIAGNSTLIGQQTRRPGACAMIGKWVKQFGNSDVVLRKGMMSKRSLSTGPPPRWEKQEKLAQACT